MGLFDRQEKSPLDEVTQLIQLIPVFTKLGETAADQIASSRLAEFMLAVKKFEARSIRVFYDALLQEGFNEEQAMALVMAQRPLISTLVEAVKKSR